MHSCMTEVRTRMRIDSIPVGPDIMLASAVSDGHSVEDDESQALKHQILAARERAIPDGAAEEVYLLCGT